MNFLIPISWLREYLKTDANARKIAELLSLHGPTVEKIQKLKEDYLLEVETTTNRQDAASVFGLAREANAILNFNGQKSTLIEPKGTNTSLLPDSKEKLKLEVAIQNPNLCPRFMAIILDNVKIKPSPALTKNRLEVCGIRSINNIVDITNYVMLELGQPMHAFDFDKIKGSKMYLRESIKGESIKTLDGVNHKLPEGSIVISDAEKLIDLCGIIGGANSQISTRTKRILFFAQAYDAVRIRKTTQALAFRTEAAARFEKGIDIERIPESMANAVYLAKKTAGAKIASELIDIYKKRPQQKTITLTKSLLEDYLGIAFNLEKAALILKLLGFTVSDKTDSLTAQPPSWRHEDMESEEDLIEEIARIYGYHNLPSTLVNGNQPQNDSQSDLSQTISLKNALKYLGLTEIMSYSIISEQYLKLTSLKKEQAVELANPLSIEWQYMRPSLLISLSSIIAQNQNLRSNLKLFEIARTYLSSRHSERSEESLPIQDHFLAVALQNSDFPNIKGLVENVFEILGREVEFAPLTRHSERGEEFALFNPQLSTLIISNGKIVGSLGILNRKIQNHFAIEGTIAAAEINLTTIYQLPATKYSYHSIPKFPPVIEDISAIFEAQTPVAEIVETVKNAGLPLLKQIEIMDIYRDEKIGQDKKSVTLHLTYQKPNSTPTQEEVSQVREKIISSVEKNLKGLVRR